MNARTSRVEAPADPDMASVFISHASADAAAALSVANFLTTYLKVPRDEVICTSAAPFNLPPGDDYERRILKALTKCDVVVALISPRSLKSLFCCMELGAAWGKKKRIAPIALPGQDIRKIGRPLASLNVSPWLAQDTWTHLLRTVENKTHADRRQAREWSNAAETMTNSLAD